MERYRNLSGDSGVVAYEIRRGSIVVEFINGSVYLYTDASAGAGRIAEMKRRARAGRGLSTYISQVVHGDYARQLR
ncbi:MAG TPA: hypothetical protein VJ722_00090 [Rhodanobacteraceae bacterium]|nr:hypothetical protein [Rhodanobacteraceae bacterium]